MHRFHPLHCILPPFVLEHMAKSPDEKVRALAVENIAASAEARAVRATLSQAPALSVLPSPAAKKHRLIYTATIAPDEQLQGLCPDHAPGRQGRVR